MVSDGVPVAIAPRALDAAAWQPILDAHADVFAEIADDACMAFLPRHVADADGARRSVVQRRCASVPMLEWRVRADAMIARETMFQGLDTLAADLLFVGNDGAFEAVVGHARANAFGEMKRRIGAGAIQLFVLRSRNALRDLGYEDFLELLGLPFLGACR